MGFQTCWEIFLIPWFRFQNSKEVYQNFTFFVCLLLAAFQILKNQMKTFLFRKNYGVLLEFAFQHMFIVVIAIFVIREPL